eukprot:symbB.v1.2.041897.t1/scaffold8827.1/size4945/1
MVLLVPNGAAQGRYVNLTKAKASSPTHPPLLLAGSKVPKRQRLCRPLGHPYRNQQRLGAEEERPPLLTDEGGEQRLCPISHLGFQKGDQSYTVNLVPIALNEGCLLVAAPEEAWSRVVAERLLPKRALTRAILAEVAVVRQEDPVTVLDSEEGMKLWVGFLDKTHTRRVVAGEGGEVDADIVKDAASEEPLYPFSQSLLEIAAEHFAFLTAESGPPVGVVGRRKDDVDQRLEGIEQTMKQVQDALAEVLRGRDVPGAKCGSFSIGAQPKRKSALRRPPAVPAGLHFSHRSSLPGLASPNDGLQPSLPKWSPAR